ncbi:MAG: ABC transporter ATP-binding protein [Gemmatimonas sp.]
MHEITLRVDNLSRRHGAFWALRDASFATSPGEILGLIGPNGSGKTTLVECVAGIQSPTSGKIFVGEKEIPPERRKEFLYLVPDGIRPWPDQTVMTVLRFIAALHRNSANALERIVQELALTPLMHSRLVELSKGEHRRVMLGIGLLTPQPILVLDEPFDGLDFRQTRDVIAVLRRHAQGGRTLFLSIHQLPDAERICDRLLLLNAGRIVGDGTLPQLQQTTGLGSGMLEDIFMALT